MSEKQIDEYWNVDGERQLSDAWTGCTRFVFYSTKGHLKDTNCQGGDLKRKETTSRPDNVCPDMWKHMSDASRRKEKQKWAMCLVKL